MNPFVCLLVDGMVGSCQSVSRPDIFVLLSEDFYKQTETFNVFSLPSEYMS